MRPVDAHDGRCRAPSPAELRPGLDSHGLAGPERGELLGGQPVLRAQTASSLGLNARGEAVAARELTPWLGVLLRSAAPLG